MLNKAFAAFALVAALSGLGLGTANPAGADSPEATKLCQTFRPYGTGFVVDVEEHFLNIHCVVAYSAVDCYGYWVRYSLDRQTWRGPFDVTRVWCP